MKCSVTLCLFLAICIVSQINFQEFSIIYFIMKFVHNHLFAHSLKITFLCGKDRCFVMILLLLCVVLCLQYCQVFCISYEMEFWAWQLVASNSYFDFSRYQCFAIVLSSLQSINFFSWISSLWSFVICWCLFIMSVISISRLVRLFTIVLYLLKPVRMTSFLAHVYHNCWLFYYVAFVTFI